jgi:hypothetical protein
MVSIKYLSGEAALSCWNVIAAERATSTKATGLLDRAFAQPSREQGASANPAPTYFSRSRLDSFPGPASGMKIPASPINQSHQQHTKNRLDNRNE